MLKKKMDEDRKNDIEMGTQMIEKDMMALGEAETKRVEQARLMKERNARAWIEQTNLKYQDAEINQMFM